MNILEDYELSLKDMHDIFRMILGDLFVLLHNFSHSHSLVFLVPTVQLRVALCAGQFSMILKEVRTPTKEGRRFI